MSYLLLDGEGHLLEELFVTGEREDSTVFKRKTLEEIVDVLVKESFESVRHFVARLVFNVLRDRVS